jgi:hypothetical protein
MVDGWDTGSVCGDPLETFCHNMCYGMNTTNMCLIGILWCLNVSVGGVFAGTNEVRWQWCCMFVLSHPLTGGFGVIRSFECPGAVPRWYHSEPGDIICQITTWTWMWQCHASGVAQYTDAKMQQKKNTHPRTAPTWNPEVECNRATNTFISL